MAKIKS